MWGIRRSPRISQGSRAQAPSPSCVEGTALCCALISRPESGSRDFNAQALGTTRPPRQMDRHPSAARLDLWERAMDGIVLGLFLAAAFFGGLVSGLSGFA